MPPKPNYSFEKRQRELEKKKKKAEKAQRKAEVGAQADTAVAPDAAQTLPAAISGFSPVV